MSPHVLILATLTKEESSSKDRTHRFKSFLQIPCRIRLGENIHS